MILVMGGHQTQRMPSYTPWNVDILKADKIKVFGITLGKTAIQDANQIFASFPKTRLVENEGKLQLLAIYHDIQFSGLLAEIELRYDLEQKKLQQLKESAIADKEPGVFLLAEEVEISLLSNSVSSLVYKPSIDYEIDIILQRFGTPDNEQHMSENISRWSYTNFKLDIIIDKAGPDTFIYSL